MSATYRNLKSYRFQSGDEGESTGDSQAADFKGEIGRGPEGGANTAHGPSFEGVAPALRETLPAPGPEGCSRCLAPCLDWCVCEDDNSRWTFTDPAPEGWWSNGGCIAWRWPGKRRVTHVQRAHVAMAAAALGRAQATHPYPGEVGQAELDRAVARKAAGGYVAGLPVLLTEAGPLCDMCGLDELSLAMIARRDRPRRRTVEVDGCRVPMWVCAACEPKVWTSPSERGWSRQVGFVPLPNSHWNPQTRLDAALGRGVGCPDDPTDQFGVALGDALDGAEHGDHVREAVYFDGWPGGSAVWLGYALGRFLLWQVGGVSRPLRDLAREAWDPLDEGGAPAHFDMGVRHG